MTGADVTANLAAIRRRINTACGEVGRAAGTVSLVAVSKLQPDDRIDAALAAGPRP